MAGFRIQRPKDRSNVYGGNWADRRNFREETGRFKDCSSRALHTVRYRGIAETRQMDIGRKAFGYSWNSPVIAGHSLLFPVGTKLDSGSIDHQMYREKMLGDHSHFESVRTGQILNDSMIKTYPAKFTNRLGTVSTSITNDGKLLTMVVRGVEFHGQEFDSFELANEPTPEDVEQFDLHLGCLHCCNIELVMPIELSDHGNVKDGKLQINVELGDETSSGGIDGHLQITLLYENDTYTGSGKSGHFEDELNEIQNQLPDGVFVKACINCLYSDYSPLGNGQFGHMMCFRNRKQEYLKVTTKEEFWPIHNHFEREVQETFLCSDFEKRIPGTGYRG